MISQAKAIHLVSDKNSVIKTEGGLGECLTIAFNTTRTTTRVVHFRQTATMALNRDGLLNKSKQCAGAHSPFFTFALKPGPTHTILSVYSQQLDEA